MEGTMENNLSPLLCRGYFVPFCIRQSRLFRNAEGLRRGCVLRLVGRVSAVKGVKYARVLLLNFFLMISEHPACDDTEKQQHMVSSECLLWYLIEINVISG